MSNSKLTQEQSKPLLDLVSYQIKSGKELKFVHFDGRIIYQDKYIMELPLIIFKVWCDREFVISNQSIGVSSSVVNEFVLTKESLLFEKRMRLSKWKRELLEVLDSWKSDLRTAIIAMIFSILTTILLRLLGLISN